MSLVDEQDLAEIIHPARAGLLACRNPVLGAERVRKREEVTAAGGQGSRPGQDLRHLHQRERGDTGRRRRRTRL